MLQFLVGVQLPGCIYLIPKPCTRCRDCFDGVYTTRDGKLFYWPYLADKEELSPPFIPVALLDGGDDLAQFLGPNGLEYTSYFELTGRGSECWSEYLE